MCLMCFKGNGQPGEQGPGCPHCPTSRIAKGTPGPSVRWLLPWRRARNRQHRGWMGMADQSCWRAEEKDSATIQIYPEYISLQRTQRLNADVRGRILIEKLVTGRGDAEERLAKWKTSRGGSPTISGVTPFVTNFPPCQISPSPLISQNYFWTVNDHPDAETLNFFKKTLFWTANPREDWCFKNTWQWGGRMRAGRFQRKGHKCPHPRGREIHTKLCEIKINLKFK